MIKKILFFTAILCGTTTLQGTDEFIDDLIAGCCLDDFSTGCCLETALANHSGVNINHAHSETGFTALHIAAIHTNLPLAQALFTAGANTFDLLDQAGKTPLECAIAFQDLALVEFFINNSNYTTIYKASVIACNMQKLYYTEFRNCFIHSLAIPLEPYLLKTCRG